MLKLLFCFVRCTDQPPKHMNFGQYIASNVPSLKQFREQSSNLQNGTSTLKALSSVMVSLQRYSGEIKFFFFFLSLGFFWFSLIDINVLKLIS
jgi:hypothetical protein